VHQFGFIYKITRSILYLETRINHLSNFEAIVTPFQHHKSYLFMATCSMYTKRELYSTHVVEMNFRGGRGGKKTGHDRVACSEMNKAACLFEHGRGNEPVLIADRETWNRMVLKFGARKQH